MPPPFWDWGAFSASAAFPAGEDFSVFMAVAVFCLAFSFFAVGSFFVGAALSFASLGGRPFRFGGSVSFSSFCFGAASFVPLAASFAGEAGAALPFFPVRRLRALSAPSPERGSRPPRAAPDLCPDRLRQSGFSIFHRPFAIPPSWFSGMKKGLDLSCQAPVVGLPPFPAPMKKPPFVVKERFFSRLAVHYFVFLYVSLCTLLQTFDYY